MFSVSVIVFGIKFWVVIEHKLKMCTSWKMKKRSLAC